MSVCHSEQAQASKSPRVVEVGRDRNGGAGVAGAVETAKADSSVAGCDLVRVRASKSSS